MDRNLKTVVDYFLDQVHGGDERPSNVVQALLALKWPDREFVCDPEWSGELCCLEAFTDKLTGMKVDDFYLSAQKLQLA